MMKNTERGRCDCERDGGRGKDRITDSILKGIQQSFGNKW